MQEQPNPFDEVKATDLTNEQIAEYFVDFHGSATILARAKPSSRMPMIIFGGKGSGKTHLIRYLSASLQLLRHKSAGKDPLQGICSDGYLGIYLLSSGLNSQRFQGKGQSEDAWLAVFAFYMELWLGQLFLSTVEPLLQSDQAFAAVEAAFVRDAVQLFDIPPATAPTTLSGLRGELARLQRSTDAAINNSALTNKLNLSISLTRGRLIFGLPRLLAQHRPELKNVVFQYLIDEFENLAVPQQRYINTLLRERQDPCSFKIGVRLYGLKTKETLGAGEENRENSEFESFPLDLELRGRTKPAQLRFASELVQRRLARTNYIPSDAARSFQLTECFELGDTDRLLQAETRGFHQRLQGREPSYFSTLRTKLRDGMATSSAPGVKNEADVDTILAQLKFPDSLLVERTNVFLFYRAWARGRTLVEVADSIRQDAQRFASDTGANEHKKVLKHFRADIVAALFRDTDQKQRYLGFESFVTMSAGLPRCLLTILKHIFTWSLFYGEQPFKSGRISIQAQTNGVQQAADWFFDEARAPGPEGLKIRDGISALGALLREMRFSDKPSECSLCTFSAAPSAVSEQARSVLAGAETWSMLVRVQRGQRERNSGRIDAKYQIHPMLAPRWDLPIARRGALSLTGAEVDALFAPPSNAVTTRVTQDRVGRLNAPLFGRKRRGKAPQADLPGLIP